MTQAQPIACPTEEEVLSFLDGRLATPAQASIDAHLGRCAACTRLFGALIDEAFAATPAAPGTTAELEATGDPASLSGRQVGRYLVLAPIGAGGMGVVYAARDPELGRDVALKLLRARQDERGEASARLLREAQAMARLSHPNVVAVYDAGSWRSQVFIAMELVAGSTLGAWLRARTRSWREVVAVFVRAGQGLAAAHAAGLVHRDFKPDNVLIADDGRVRVTDFGLARVAGGGEPDAPSLPTPLRVVAIGKHHLRSPLTRSGMLIGSPAYMAPEQMQGRPAEPRSDLFSFCVALHEGLYGERPFAGETLAELRQSIERGQLRPAPKARRVPSFLRRVLERGLSARLEDRPASMDALLAELQRDPMVARRRLAAAALVALAVLASAAAYRRSAWRPATASLSANYEENSEPPALSPDGQLLAYASDREDRRGWRLYVEPLAGGPARALTRAGSRPHCARFSRDGQSVLFVEERSGEARRVPVQGGEARVVATGVECVEDCGARGLLLVRSGAPGCESCERITLLAGGAERDLVRVGGRNIRPLRCDRQEQQFTYATVGREQSEIRVAGFDGKERVLVESRDFLADPAFAADGRSVLYGASVGEAMNIYEVPLPGGSPRRVTFGPGPHLGPEPTPDGQQLVYQLDQTPRLLSRIDLATGQRRRVSSRLQDVRSATPTLDGRAVIARVLHHDGPHIAELPLDGRSERLLARGVLPDLTTDDREILFAQAESATRSRVFAVPRLGGEPRAVTAVEGVIHDLAVGADGRVHLRVDRGEARSAWSAPIGGGPATLDAPAPWSFVVPLAGGHRMGLRPTGYFDRVYAIPPGVPLEAGPLDPRIRALPARVVQTSRDLASIVYWDGWEIIRYTPSSGAHELLLEHGLPGEFALSADGKGLILGEFSGAIRREVVTNFADRPR